MDIIEARKKAKELDQKQKRQPKKALKPAAKKRAQEEKKKAESKKVAKKVAQKKPGSKKAKPSEPEPKKTEAPAKEEIFMDFSFGEDLPDTEIQPSEARPGREEKVVFPPETEKPAPAVPEAKRPGFVPVPFTSEEPEDMVFSESEGSEGQEKKAPDMDFLKLVEEDLYHQGFGEEPLRELGPQLALLSFQLGDEIYAVPLTSIQQIIKMRGITFVPRSPEYVAGVISLRGMVLPVFDLRRRLGLPARDYARETRIIVVMVDGITCGLIVDRVKQVVRIPEDSLEEPPAILGGVGAEFLDGIGRFNHQMLILLNLGKVLDLQVGGEERANP
jgi:purine-binding chemotaxis protein CheW